MASKTHTSARPTPAVVSCGSHGTVLAAMGGGDEGAVAAGAGEDDVARLVADEQRAHDARRRQPPTSTMLTLSERWLTTQTSLFVRAATATGSRPTGTEPVWVRPPAATVKIEAVVGRVDREQPRAVGRHRQRPHLAGLERDERARGPGPRGEQRERESPA